MEPQAKKGTGGVCSSSESMCKPAAAARSNTAQASWVQEPADLAVLGLALLLSFGFFEEFAEFRNCGHVR